ncbi:50S ribosomal protein L33 [Ureaplasma sp. ES3154-GEN]|nr:50S ribosomal protein L33 [Ureaplasma sp. ES3154-GEN]MCV3743593.1 50S ribosomal protein L33 [Ureaplasma sp. ES3154-GEN]
MKKVILVCEDCLARNYHTTRNQYAQERLALKKYCPHCERSVLHKETR